MTTKQTRKPTKYAEKTPVKQIRMPEETMKKVQHGAHMTRRTDSDFIRVLIELGCEALEAEDYKVPLNFSFAVVDPAELE